MLKVDLSNNQLTGVADILIAPSISFVNLSHNMFASVAHTAKSRTAYNSIETVDLSHNLISGGASDLFSELPPNLKRLNMKDNSLSGTLPFDLPILTKMEIFDLSDNNLMGDLPDFSRSMPRVLKLYLSGQKGKGIGGFSGSIPQAISSLLDLLDLDLSNNNLSGKIPPTIGNIPRLKLLNLSNNDLTGSIDAELGKLSGMIHCCAVLCCVFNYQSYSCVYVVDHEPQVFLRYLIYQ
jgi:Leucine-rich repeat (LRR) protein